MEPYQNLFKKSNYHHLALLVVLILYSVLNIQTPSMLANLIDNIYGNIVIIIAAFYLFAHCHPIVGVVGLFAAYELIRRSSHSTGTLAIERYLPTEIKKSGHFSAFNQFPVTLEEEVVKQMAPLVESAGPSNLNYKPASEETHNAMDVHDTTSVI
ncbi:hypothetical protein N9K75_01435 [bacterium]|jgi:hypothetical protein|nr:hypothetical protein [bacterium]|tara:strand:+ start:1773 stop:2237 length:465 start_codon:yes stop_codon:yes gene_type:complete